MPELTYREYLNARFGGVLKAGAHPPNGAACALESINAWRGHEWTDSPVTAGMPDLRRLNDAYPDDPARTTALVPVIEAYAGWADWAEARRVLVAQSLALLTIQRVLPLALRAVGLEKHAIACETAADLVAAAEAAYAAAEAAYAPTEAAYAAAEAAATAETAAAVEADFAAAEAADAAAEAAATAVEARILVLNTACQCWLEAAQTGAREESAQ